ncbi:MAG: tRNA (adenosine(37)-N6)-threonylcarbamoyltransferase complex ATPase subunit type 1 TsaE [Hyphomicrobiaceae bacterium]
MTGGWTIEDGDEARLGQVAAWLALIVAPGDTVALRGDLGAGKTTFARALIRAIAGADLEVTSPTFPIMLRYETARMIVHHIDLYRLGGEEEARLSGIDEAMSEGLAIVEWPERAEGLMPADHFEVAIGEGPTPDTRAVTLSGRGEGTAGRVERLIAMAQFAGASGHDGASPRFLFGDASRRAYARIGSGSAASVLMDSPRQPDGPPIRDGLPYSRIAHLAEDVRPFVAVGQELGRLGLSAPEIRATDLERGFLMVEDLGDRVYGALVAAGEPMLPLWRAATCSSHCAGIRRRTAAAAGRRRPLTFRPTMPGRRRSIERPPTGYVPAATGRPLDARGRGRTSSPGNRCSRHGAVRPALGAARFPLAEPLIDRLDAARPRRHHRLPGRQRAGTRPVISSH